MLDAQRAHISKAPQCTANRTSRWNWVFLALKELMMTPKFLCEEAARCQRLKDNIVEIAAAPVSFKVGRLKAGGELASSFLGSLRCGWRASLR